MARTITREEVFQIIELGPTTRTKIESYGYTRGHLQDHLAALVRDKRINKIRGYAGQWYYTVLDELPEELQYRGRKLPPVTDKVLLWMGYRPVRK